MSTLCQHTNARIIVPDYPLALAHTCTEVYEFVESLHDNLFKADDDMVIILMGDSARGGLALGVSNRLILDKSSNLLRIFY